MGRKIFGLDMHLEDDEPTSTETPSPARRPSAPSVSSFRDALRDLSSAAVIEVDTEKIGSSRFQDRFDASAEIETLAASIKESGQQVPVLLRQTDGRDTQYEPVYGRRRIAACRSLGIPVRAIVSDLDETGVIVAQGLENNERLDSSFIEKASFIDQLKKAKVPAGIIEQALGVHRSEVSRMMQVLAAVPDELVDLIGPAHGAGRRPWMMLANEVGRARGPKMERAKKACRETSGSRERLEAVLSVMVDKPTPAAPKKVGDGAVVLVRKKTSLNMTLKQKGDEDFLTWIEARGDDLYQQWKKERSS